MAVYIECKNHDQDHDHQKHKITSLLLELKKIEDKLMEDMHASCSPEVVEKQDEDRWKLELAEMWSKSKTVCNEIGIDFGKNGLPFSTSSSEEQPL